MWWGWGQRVGPVLLQTLLGLLIGQAGLDAGAVETLEQLFNRNLVHVELKLLLEILCLRRILLLGEGSCNAHYILMTRNILTQEATTLYRQTLCSAAEVKSVS